MSKSMIPLDTFYAAEEGRLKRLIRRITGCAFAAEDVVQDAFIKLSGRHLSNDDRGLLVTTARNLALDHVRQQKRRQEILDGVLPEQFACAPTTPEQNLGAKQEADQFVAALAELPTRMQRAFLMSKLDGLSHREIARELSVSISTVEKDIMAALLFCRQWQKTHDLF
jgi:RNA polymerase sigma factor (sigma-70 family)